MDKTLLLNYIKNGASLDKNLQMINKKSGFMCSLFGYEKTFQENDIENIYNTILEYRSRIKVNQYIGLWNDNGLVYVDISRHYKRKQDAIKNGIINKQLAIYDIKKDRSIYLTKNVYILYKYNKITNDIMYIREFTNVKDIEKTLNKTYNTLKNYIIKSIDSPIKELLQDKYIIIKDEAYIRDLD